MDKRKLEQRMYPREEHDSDFREFVSDLLQLGRLEGNAVQGIGKKIVAEGSSSLTESQRKTFIEYGLLKENYVEYCGRCAEHIPWSEMTMALDDGYCSYCRHLMEKDD